MSARDKLVRDKIPEIIRARGITPITHHARQAEFLNLLADKLQEEAAEFAESGVIVELSDILEVVRAICEARGISLEELEKMREQKLAERGGFKKRIVLEGICGNKPEQIA